MRYSSCNRGRFQRRQKPWKNNDVLTDGELSTVPGHLKGMFRFLVAGEVSPIDLSMAKDSEYKFQLIGLLKTKAAQYLSEGNVKRAMRCLSFCPGSVGEIDLTRLGDRLLERHPYDALSAYKLAGNRKRLEEIGDESFRKGVIDIAVPAYKLAWAKGKLRAMADNLLENGGMDKAKEIYYYLGDGPADPAGIAKRMLAEWKNLEAFAVARHYCTEEGIAGIGRLALKQGGLSCAIRCFEHLGDHDGVVQVARAYLKARSHEALFALLDNESVSVTELGKDGLSSMGRSLLKKGMAAAAERAFTFAEDRDGLLAIARLRIERNPVRALKMIEENGGKPEDFEKCGETLLQMNKHRLAVIAFAKASCGHGSGKFKDALDRYMERIFVDKTATSTKRIEAIEEIVELCVENHLPVDILKKAVAEIKMRSTGHPPYYSLMLLSMLLGDKKAIEGAIADAKSSIAYPRRQFEYNLLYGKAAKKKDYSALALLEASRTDYGYSKAFANLSFFFFSKLPEKRQKSIGPEIVARIRGAYPLQALRIYHAIGDSRGAKVIIEGMLGGDLEDEAVSLARAIGTQEILSMVAGHLMVKKDLPRALDLYRRADDRNGILEVAKAHLADGDNDRGEAIISRIKDRVPESVLTSYATTFLMQGAIGRAKRWYGFAKKKIPPELFAEAGRKAFAKGGTDDLLLAKECFILAGGGDALAEVGDAFLAKSMIGTALKCYDLAGMPERKFDAEIYGKQYLELGLDILMRNDAPKEKLLAFAAHAVGLGEIGAATRAYAHAGVPFPDSLLSEGYMIYSEKRLSLRALLACVMAGDVEKIEMLLRPDGNP